MNNDTEAQNRITILESQLQAEKDKNAKWKQDLWSTQEQTLTHIETIRSLLKMVIGELCDRISAHDRSKLFPPEVDTFIEYTPKLKGSTYGSDEYKQFLAEMKPALDNHYANNRHHPEWFEDGIDGMNLIDLIEMLIDWKAATLRHDDGCILKSLELNKERFGISDQLSIILENTVEYLKLKDWDNT